MHRKAQQSFERTPLQSPQGNSAIVWDRGNPQFHKFHQIFRAALFFFAPIPFEILFMTLAILTAGLFRSVAPVLIVLIFITGA
jgi:hypothetical protein